MWSKAKVVIDVNGDLVVKTRKCHTVFEQDWVTRELFFFLGVRLDEKVRPVGTQVCLPFLIN